MKISHLPTSHPPLDITSSSVSLSEHTCSGRTTRPERCDTFSVDSCFITFPADNCFISVEKWPTDVEKLSSTLGLRGATSHLLVRSFMMRDSLPPYQVSGPCSILPTKEDRAPFTPFTLLRTANTAASTSRSCNARKMQTSCVTRSSCSVFVRYTRAYERVSTETYVLRSGRLLVAHLSLLC